MPLSNSSLAKSATPHYVCSRRGLIQGTLSISASLTSGAFAHSPPEQAEHHQHVDRERPTEHKCGEQLVIIISLGRDVILINTDRLDTTSDTSERPSSISMHMEKGIEGEECHKLLKATDEEAYTKIIDTANDTLITRRMCTLT